MRSEAAEALPALGLAADTSEILLGAIKQVSFPPQEEEPTTDQWRQQAIWFMAIIGYRALRAAMTVITTGYEDQSGTYQRLLQELHGRALAVRRDKSGEIAKNWIAGRPTHKGAKIVGQDMWEFLSGPVHANAKAVFDWLAVSQSDGTAKIVVLPERRAELSNAALAFMASVARDLANLLALECSIQLDLAELDPRIKAAEEKYLPDVEIEGEREVE